MQAFFCQGVEILISGKLPMTGNVRISGSEAHKTCVGRKRYA